MDCCDNAGGRVTLKINGKQYKARAVGSIMPTNTEVTVEANGDGSIFSTTKAVPAEGEFTLSDSCDLVLSDVQGCHVDVTFTLTVMKRTYYFSRATIGGRPSLNPSTGEITGFKCFSQSAKQV